MINNIKEFIDYKDNKCYFCENELNIEPQVFGNIAAKFAYQDNELIVTSRYVNLNINVINNTVEAPDTEPRAIPLLLSKQRLFLLKVCRNTQGCHAYTVGARFAFDPNNMIVMPTDHLTEDVALYTEYRLLIDHINQSCDLTFLSFNADIGSKFVPHVAQKIPYIDISKINRIQLKEKLNLYKAFI